MARGCKRQKVHIGINKRASRAVHMFNGGFSFEVGVLVSHGVNHIVVACTQYIFCTIWKHILRKGFKHSFGKD